MKKLLLPLLLIGFIVNQSQAQYSYELYVSGIDVPWGMDWLPNGDMLVTDRGGELYIVKSGEFQDETISGLPDDILAQRQGGLLDVRVHPNYSENGWIYLAYSFSEGGNASTKVVRAKLDGNALTDMETIYKADPNSNRGVHYGGRLEFDNDGYLFFSIGDRGYRDDLPQDLSKDGGKIYRLMDDGSIPADNPFVGSEDDSVPATYSYGHRNPQGMAMNPATGMIWTHEHGPRGGDELNIIYPGRNYGWPILSYGINYSGTSFAEGTEREGMESPINYWVPSIAPSGMAFVTSDNYPDWKGHLIVGSLKFNNVELLKLDGDRVVGIEKVLEGIGRVRSVEEGPDGNIYIGVAGQGIFKVVKG